MVPVPAIESEKVDNMTVEHLKEELTKVIFGSNDASYGKVTIGNDYLKAVLNKETFERITRLEANEQIIVMLAMLGDSNGQNSLLTNDKLELSTEATELLNDVLKNLKEMDAYLSTKFAFLLDTYFPEQKVKVGEAEYIYYMIPLEITTENGTQIKHIAFCFDPVEQTWLFTPVEVGNETTE